MDYQLQSDSIDLLETAFNEAQKKFPVVTKDMSGHFRYASAAEIIREIVPILNDNHLNIRQSGIPATTENSQLIIVTQLSHISGQFIRSWWPVPLPRAEELKGINFIQAMMSNKTYIERHALKALLCLAVDDDDTDGEYVVDSERKITDRQYSYLLTLISKNPRATDWIKKNYEVDDLRSILRSDFNAILEVLKKYSSKTDQPTPF